MEKFSNFLYYTKMLNFEKILKNIFYKVSIIS